MLTSTKSVESLLEQGARLVRYYGLSGLYVRVPDSFFPDTVVTVYTVDPYIAPNVLEKFGQQVIDMAKPARRSSLSATIRRGSDLWFKSLSNRA